MDEAAWSGNTYECFWNDGRKEVFVGASSEAVPRNTFCAAHRIDVITPDGTRVTLKNRLDRVPRTYRRGTSWGFRGFL